MPTGVGAPTASNGPAKVLPALDRAKAVILAGGRGTRLQPFTFVLPKPLIPVGEEPVIGLLLKQLRRHGFRDAIVTLGHYAGIIRALLTGLDVPDLNITCVEEKKPLGTVGALRIAQDYLKDDFLVTNGDIVTDLDFRKLMQHHKKKNAIATVACYRRTSTVPYGVIKVGKHRELISFLEKPQKVDLVNMGVYVFRPEVFRYIPAETPFGADDLLLTLLDAHQLVATYVHKGLWTDIGQVSELHEARDLFPDYQSRISGD